jgi:hypothetical protein
MKRDNGLARRIVSVPQEMMAALYAQDNEAFPLQDRKHFAGRNLRQARSCTSKPDRYHLLDGLPRILFRWRQRTTLVLIDFKAEFDCLAGVRPSLLER